MVPFDCIFIPSISQRTRWDSFSLVQQRVKWEKLGFGLLNSEYGRTEFLAGGQNSPGHACQLVGKCHHSYVPMCAGLELRDPRPEYMSVTICVSDDRPRTLNEQLAQIAIARQRFEREPKARSEGGICFLLDVQQEEVAQIRICGIDQQAFERVLTAGNGPGTINVEPVIEAAKVFPDGQEESVRNLNISSLTLGSFKDIVAVSDTPDVYRPRCESKFVRR